MDLLWWAMKQMRSKLILKMSMLAGLILFITIAAIHNVSKSITVEDKEYITKIVELENFEWPNLTQHDGFEQEIEDIRAIQQAVLNLTAVQKQIPSFQTREPKDLYNLKYAQCSDRSRVIDKMLRLAGFKTRVASVYKTDKTGSAIKSLLSHDKSKVRSHSIVEVKTAKGWMMVDTNDLWIGLDKNENPVDLEQWQSQVSDDQNFWNASNKGEIYWLMTLPYTYVYGLYSRHGYFYPPYNPIPDVNWIELLENL